MERLPCESYLAGRSLEGTGSRDRIKFLIKISILGLPKNLSINKKKKVKITSDGQRKELTSKQNRRTSPTSQDRRQKLWEWQGLASKRWTGKLHVRAQCTHLVPGFWEWSCARGGGDSCTRQTEHSGPSTAASGSCCLHKWQLSIGTQVGKLDICLGFEPLEVWPIYFLPGRSTLYRW